jgi:hypothetical protein
VERLSRHATATLASSNRLGINLHRCRKGRTVMVLAAAGKAGLRLLFLRQQVDNAQLYPTLYRQLGVVAILK